MKHIHDRLFSVHYWVNAVAGGAAIATLLGFAGDLWWGFSFLDHPRLQYSLALLIAIFVGVTTRQPWQVKRWSLLWSLPLLINLTLIAPLFLPSQSSRNLPPSAPLTLRVLHATLDHDNPDVSQAIQWVETQQADVVSLLEVTPDSLPHLQAGLKHYQLAAAAPRTNSHGSAWFVARHATAPIAVQSQEIIHLPGNSDRPLLKLVATVGGREITFLCFHVIRPRNAGTVAYQRVELGALRQWSQRLLQTEQRNLIVIGDFNSTPWTVSFRQLLQTSGLVNSQKGFGLQPTWHSSLPPLLRIPIDHCLHSPTFTTVHREIGANTGSDHLPLWVELQLKTGS